MVDRQIGPCCHKASRILIIVLAVSEACEQNPSVRGSTACAKSGVPSTATASENSLVFIILTFLNSRIYSSTGLSDCAAVCNGWKINSKSHYS